GDSAPEASTARFDFGLAGEDSAEEEVGASALLAPETSSITAALALDSGTGWSVHLVAGSGGIIGRNRGPLAASAEPEFTLDDVYIDFVTGWEFLRVENLDPTRTYDLQVIMFDDNGSPGRTQTLTDVTSELDPVELGTTDGPGTSGSGALVDNFVYSVEGSELVPDSSGTLELLCTNSNTGDRCLSNGVIITENSL
ncbi:MAG: hypothetical protein AAFQ82_22110, partial [Myxococcota bacterium]